MYGPAIACSPSAIEMVARHFTVPFPWSAHPSGSTAPVERSGGESSPIVVGDACGPGDPARTVGELGTVEPGATVADDDGRVVPVDEVGAVVAAATVVGDAALERGLLLVWTPGRVVDVAARAAVVTCELDALDVPCPLEHPARARITTGATNNVRTTSPSLLHEPANTPRQRGRRKTPTRDAPAARALQASRR